eukprot:Gb_38517 [translate_table: standard]
MEELSTLKVTSRYVRIELTALRSPFYKYLQKPVDIVLLQDICNYVVKEIWKGIWQIRWIDLYPKSMVAILMQSVFEAEMHTDQLCSEDFPRKPKVTQFFTWLKFSDEVANIQQQQQGILIQAKGTPVPFGLKGRSF